MSQSPSPYSEPVQPTPPPSGPSSNWVVIIAIVAGTMLLLCGGLIGLGFYAVDRLANQLSELAEEFGDWDEGEGAVALEFAISENPEIRQRVGEIEQVDSEPDLTYHENAGAEDYYFRVRGSSGDALVVVQYAEEEHRWFKSVELVEGDGLNDPRTALTVRNAPFDSQLSKQVYDRLVEEDGSAAQGLNVGAIRWIAYDDERSLELSEDRELVFDIEGESGTVSVIARFENVDYEVIESLHRVDEQGQPQERIDQEQEPTDEAAGDAGSAAA